MELTFQELPNQLNKYDYYTIEELLGRSSSGSGLEDREYGRGDQLS
jgi:hypothetical protein